MTSSLVEQQLADVRAVEVRVTDETIAVDLEDGRTIVVPTAWYPRLKHAAPAERAAYRIGAYGVEWPAIEADFSIRGLLLGNKSGENVECLRYWLQNRQRGKRVTVMQWLALQRKRRTKSVTQGTRPRAARGKRS